MTENIGELVAEHPLFSGLPADVAKLVAGCSQNVAIATGQLLLEEVAADRDAMAHQDFIGGAAHAHQVDAFSAL